MKTINSNNKYSVNCVEVDSTYKFVGFAEVYDKKIYVDTKSGQGYDEVIKEMRKLINFFASKYRFPGFAFEDTKQHVIMHMLDVMCKYDPTRETKLSTFIQMSVNRRLINELRNESNKSKNATTLNVRVYNFVCACGHSHVVEEDYIADSNCEYCNRNLSEAKKYPVINTTVSMSNVPGVNEDGDFIADDFISRSDPNMSFLYEEDVPVDSSVIYNHDFMKWLEGEDSVTRKIVELMYFEDYSMSAAASKIGLSHTGAKYKLRILSNKKEVRELFGR